MAGRKRKRSVDYFPHMVTHGKTLFVIEQKFGNDGYAVLFKTFELLAGEDEHFFNFSDEEDWLYICAKFNSDPEIVKSVLCLMAKLGAIDNELYLQNILWSDNLISNLAPVYEKRKSELPHRPISDPEMPISDPEITQSKVKESKGEKSKEEKPIPQPDGSGTEDEHIFYLTKKKKKLTGKRLETFETFWNTFAYKSSKAEAADAWLEIPMLTEAIFKQILKAAEAEAAKRPGLIAEGKTPKMAQGWITGRRWEDEGITQLPTIDAAEQTRRMLAEKLA